MSPIVIAFKKVKAFNEVEGLADMKKPFKLA